MHREDLTLYTLCLVLHRQDGHLYTMCLWCVIHSDAQRTFESLHPIFVKLTAYPFVPVVMDREDILRMQGF